MMFFWGGHGGQCRAYCGDGEASCAGRLDGRASNTKWCLLWSAERVQTPEEKKVGHSEE